MTYPDCPQCNENYTYVYRGVYVCPMCSHEWRESEADEEPAIRDAHGTVLNDGDSIIIIKDLKVKGASSVLKQGTKVKNITLVEGDHNIDCRIDGFGAMSLKSEFVKKA